MIVRDGEQTLPLALSSLLRQTYEHWECLCVDDASVDGSRELLESLTDQRFKLICSDEPLGRGQARSLALKHVSGEFIATLDSDDFYFQDTLKTHVEVLRSDSHVVASVGQLALFDQNEILLGRPRRKMSAGERTIPTRPKELKIPFGSMVFRVSAIGGLDYDHNLKRSEDRDFFSRMLAGTRIQVLGFATYAYRWGLEYNNVLQGLKENEVLYLAHISEHPLATCSLVLVNRIKLYAYQALHSLGLWNALNKLRIRELTDSQRLCFEAELSETRRVCDSLFL